MTIDRSPQSISERRALSVTYQKGAYILRSKNELMLRSFEYRLYPTNKQEARLYSTFHLCSEMYNLLLTEHEAVYEQAGISLSRYDLNNRITGIKQHDTRFMSVYSLVLQNQADRLSKAFNNFFRRCQENKQDASIKVGYPRYKRLIHSITYPANNGSFKLIANKIIVSKIGKIPIVLHRPIMGTIKTLTIKRNRRASGSRYSAANWMTKNQNLIEAKRLA